MAFLQVASRGGLDEVPYDVIIDNIIPHLGINYIGRFATASKQCNNHVDSADKIAKKQLENKIKPEIEKMINNSGIEGIEIPKGPFHNYLHQYISSNSFQRRSSKRDQGFKCQLYYRY